LQRLDRHPAGKHLVRGPRSGARTVGGGLHDGVNRPVHLVYTRQMCVDHLDRRKLALADQARELVRGRHVQLACKVRQAHIRKTIKATSRGRTRVREAARAPYDRRVSVA
jgi:hypothetical protein